MYKKYYKKSFFVIFSWLNFKFKQLIHTKGFILRKCTDEDISDEECKNVIDPFYDNYDIYLEEYVVLEVIAFYIASSYSRNAMWEATFYQHYNSAKDTFNVSDDEDYDSIKAEVIKLLRMKYYLEIICENPLDFKKIGY